MSKEHLEEFGWCVIDLPFWGNLNNICALIQRNNPLGYDSWESYEEDSEHTALQLELTEILRHSRYIGSLFKENGEVFRSLLDKNNSFLYQNHPYLRIARVSKSQDNIGYHKDTMYGGYPEELSVVIPLVDLDEGMALQVLDGSHRIPDEEFRYNKVETTDIKKGDTKNSLGFLYAPKVMDETQLSGIHSVPLNFGQALVFYLSTVHGQVVNTGAKTRWSIDTRIVQKDSGLDFSKRPYKYVELPR